MAIKDLPLNVPSAIVSTGRLVALANDVLVVHEEVGKGGAEGVEVVCHCAGASECGVVCV